MVRGARCVRRTWCVVRGAWCVVRALAKSQRKVGERRSCPKFGPARSLCIKSGRGRTRAVRHAPDLPGYVRRAPNLPISRLLADSSLRTNTQRDRSKSWRLGFGVWLPAGLIRTTRHASRTTFSVRTPPRAPRTTLFVRATHLARRTTFSGRATPYAPRTTFSGRATHLARCTTFSGRTTHHAPRTTHQAVP